MNKRDREAKLTAALDAVKEIFPDTGIIILTAESESDGMTVNSASNISRKGQLILLLDVTANFAASMSEEESHGTAH